MLGERRQHLRYRPVSAIEAVLHWQEGTEKYRASTLLHILSPGGCSLILDHPPPVNSAVALELHLGHEAPSLWPTCLTGRTKIGDSWLLSLSFQPLSAEQQAALLSALNSAAFHPDSALVAPAHSKHWRVDQWAAYLTVQRLPVMARSKAAFAALEAAQDDTAISPRAFADLANRDPFFCLSLLREAEGRRTSRLGHETTTPLAAVLQMGETGVRDLLMSSPESDEMNQGLIACESRAVLAGRLAAAWSSARADVSPDELVMAALLAEIGELMLWHFAPDLPQAALDSLASGASRRTSQAQELSCGFKFKDLTVKCAEIWNLPVILVQLIRGTDSARANIARICINTARHLAAGFDNPALPDDIADIKQLIPNGSLPWLTSCLVGLPEEIRQELVEKAAKLLEQND